MLIAASYGGNVYCTKVTAFQKRRLYQYSSFGIDACIVEEYITIYSRIDILTTALFRGIVSYF